MVDDERTPEDVSTSVYIFSSRMPVVFKIRESIAKILYTAAQWILS
jgi:hypothetical protein